MLKAHDLRGFSPKKKQNEKTAKLLSPFPTDDKAGGAPVEARPATSMSRRVPEKPRDPDALENEVPLAFTGGGNAHDLYDFHVAKYPIVPWIPLLMVEILPHLGCKNTL